MKKLIYQGTFDAFNQLISENKVSESTLYYISDKKWLYKGQEKISGGIEVFTELPDLNGYSYNDVIAIIDSSTE